MTCLRGRLGAGQPPAVPRVWRSWHAVRASPPKTPCGPRPSRRPGTCRTPRERRERSRKDTRGNRHAEVQVSSRRQVKSSGRTVLVVDDQVETLSSVRMLLEREGHRVLTAEGGPQALELLAREPVQLLLVDYFMPVMNG